MTEASGFRSELRDTYRDTNGNPASSQPTGSEPENGASAPSPQASAETPPQQPHEQSYTPPKQTYKAATASADTAPAPVINWTRGHQIKLAALMAAFGAVIGLGSTIAMLLSSHARDVEIPVILAGMVIGGAEIAIATSFVIWHYLKSGRSLKLPLAIANLVLLVLHIPIGIAIAGNLYYIFIGGIAFQEIMMVPFIALQKFYWVMLVMMPVALASWQLQNFTIKRFFTGESFIPTGSTGSMGDSAGRFAVKRSNTAARCDICHQDDEFIAKTSFCRRCQRYTV